MQPEMDFLPNQVFRTPQNRHKTRNSSTVKRFSFITTLSHLKKMSLNPAPPGGIAGALLRTLLLAFGLLRTLKFFGANGRG